MKRQLLLIFTTMMAICSHAQDYVYTTDFSTSEEGANNGETIVGSGHFVSTNEEGAIFNNYYQNDGSRKRTSYCLLPEDVLAHSATSKELSIAFWVNAEGLTPNQYTYSPFFAAYTGAPNNGKNSYPMMILQSRGNVQVNCNGWCDFTPANNVAGKNNIYNDNAWEASDNSYNKCGNWLEDEKWHYYTAVFTETNVKVYLDGEVKNEWNIDGKSDGQVISGLFSTGAELKYVCVGGNQAWDWNDNDSPFRYAHLLITNKAMTPEAIKAQIKTDFGDNFDDYLTSIKTIKSDKSNSSRYNLSGQQVTTDYKGIVIMQGKKVLIK